MLKLIQCSFKNMQRGKYIVNSFVVIADGIWGITNLNVSCIKNLF